MQSGTKAEICWRSKQSQTTVLYILLCKPCILFRRNSSIFLTSQGPRKIILPRSAVTQKLSEKSLQWNFLYKQLFYLLRHIGLCYQAIDFLRIVYFQLPRCKQRKFFVVVFLMSFLICRRLQERQIYSNIGTITRKKFQPQEH